MTARPIGIRWISEVPSKIIKIRDFREKAVLTVVSPASAVQGTAEVRLRDRPVEATPA